MSEKGFIMGREVPFQIFTNSYDPTLITRPKTFHIQHPAFLA
jgi:hypothetical protein